MPPTATLSKARSDEFIAGIVKFAAQPLPINLSFRRKAHSPAGKINLNRADPGKLIQDILHRFNTMLT